MKKLLPFLRWIPEVVLIGVSIIYWEFAGLTINFIAITLIVLLLLQILLKRNLLGLTLGYLFGFLSLWMVLAVLYEFAEYCSLTEEAQNMLFFGGGICLTSLLMSTLLVLKYIDKPSELKINSQALKRIFHFIFSDWLTHSGYTLDQRPHFEVL